jgi:hypothetical protein
MMGFYNWLICKLFKRCEIEIYISPTESFKRYCETNPWERECKIHDN